MSGERYRLARVEQTVETTHHGRLCTRPLPRLTLVSSMNSMLARNSTPDLPI